MFANAETLVVYSEMQTMWWVTSLLLVPIHESTGLGIKSCFYKHVQEQQVPMRMREMFDKEIGNY